MSDLTSDSQVPSSRADVEFVREKTSIHFTGKAPGGFEAALDVNTDGSGQSPTASAVTMLMLVIGACLAAVTVAVICKLAAAPPLLLVIAALATFVGVLIICTIISFRRDSAARSRQEATSSHLTPNGVAREVEGNGTAQAISREAHQNGHQVGKEHKDKKSRSGKPSRR
jgi:hypothetical protein